MLILARPAADCLKVAQLTKLLTATASADRLQVMRSYIQQATASATDPQPPLSDSISNLRHTLKQVLKLPWDNHNKEILWRLALNGIPGAGGCGICFNTPCLCGARLTHHQLQHQNSAAHRQHAFWDCPVAQAVVAQLRAFPDTQNMQQQHLWLLQPPSASILPAVWQIAGLAALTAMERGRRKLWAARHQQPSQSNEITTAQAAEYAVTCWRDSIQDFANTNSFPIGLQLQPLHSQHPFLAVTVPAVPLSPRLTVNLPH